MDHVRFSGRKLAVGRSVAQSTNARKCMTGPQLIHSPLYNVSILNSSRLIKGLLTRDSAMHRIFAILKEGTERRDQLFKNTSGF
jgi:hypothetical protein